MVLGAEPSPKQANVIYNLNSSDIRAIFPSAINYSIIQSDNITAFSGHIAQSGYSYVSVSLFNATRINNQSIYPALISSSVFVTSSTSAASSLEDGIANALAQDIVLPGNQTSSSGNAANGVITSKIGYSYKGANTTIMTIFNTNAFNSTTPAQIQAGKYPLYESWSAFSYKNMAGFIVTIGYTHLYGSYSVILAERLFQHIVNGNASRQQ